MANPDQKADKPAAEISDADLDQVTGGEATHALPAVQNGALPAVQSTSIGSQSTGAGAGKVTFNPF